MTWSSFQKTWSHFQETRSHFKETMSPIKISNTFSSSYHKFLKLSRFFRKPDHIFRKPGHSFRKPGTFLGNWVTFSGNQVTFPGDSKWPFSWFSDHFRVEKLCRHGEYYNIPIVKKIKKINLTIHLNIPIYKGMLSITNCHQTFTYNLFHFSC